jgi:hypothetical protein
MEADAMAADVRHKTCAGRRGARGGTVCKTALRSIPGSAVRGVLFAAIGVGVMAAGQGCKPQQPPKPAERYTTLPLKQVPPYLKESIMEQTDLVGTEPLPVSAYGLVSGLRNTGDSQAPTAVREWMIREMTKRGFGQRRTGLEGAAYQPEAILSDPAYAIVRVDGFLPPGVRKGQTFDVYVSALPDSKTSSLAHGDLYETEMSIGGAEMPTGTNVHRIAIAGGPLFVNPAYALTGSKLSAQGKTSLRYGVVMDGGVNRDDRAMGLRLRQPQRSLARRIGDRINERFQAEGDISARGGASVGQYITAIPQDEGIVSFYVPEVYRGDWEHFVGVVTHLYMRSGNDFALVKAKELAAEAVKPDALLQDISYAWEGLGTGALPAITPLMTHEKPDVAFSAARAAAFLNEPSSLTALVRMAKDPKSPFQSSAVQALASLQPTPQINQMLKKLLDGNNASVRIAAYEALSRNEEWMIKRNKMPARDRRIFSKVVRERFVLDIVTCDGPTLVYASRTGLPRIAIIGSTATIRTPLMYTAMDGALTIASDPDGRSLSVFYRGPELPRAVRAKTNEPELAELIVRLAGEGTKPREVPLNFSYADIVAIVQRLTDSQKLASTPTGSGSAGSHTASFVLQDLANTDNAVYNAPVITDASAGSNQGGVDTLPELNPNDVGDPRNGQPNRQSRPQ